MLIKMLLLFLSSFFVLIHLGHGQPQQQQQHQWNKIESIKKMFLEMQGIVMKNDDWLTQPEDLLKPIFALQCDGQFCTKNSSPPPPPPTELNMMQNSEPSPLGDELCQYFCHNNKNKFLNLNSDKLLLANLMMSFKSTRKELGKFLKNIEFDDDGPFLSGETVQQKQQKQQTVQEACNFLQLIVPKLDNAFVRNALSQFGKSVTPIKPNEVLKLATTMTKIGEESVLEMMARLKDQPMQKEVATKLEGQRREQQQNDQQSKNRRRKRDKLAIKQQIRTAFLLLISGVIVYATFIILTILSILFNTLVKAMEHPVILLLASAALFIFLRSNNNKTFTSKFLPEPLN